MDAILTEVLSVMPDVVLLQEVQEDGMLAALERRCPRAEWQVCRRQNVDMPYFNVTMVGKGCGAAALEWGWGMGWAPPHARLPALATIAMTIGYGPVAMVVGVWGGNF